MQGNEPIPCLTALRMSQQPWFCEHKHTLGIERYNAKRTYPALLAAQGHLINDIQSRELWK